MEEKLLEYVMYITTDGTYDYSSHTKGVDAFRQLEIYNNPDLTVKVVSADYQIKFKEENYNG
jgi:hypothetical protein